jgi:hypothetical protein
MSTVIWVISDPWPEHKKPDFVTRACIGLCLTAALKILPGKDAQYPQGVYLVPLSDIMKKIKQASPDAHEWLKDVWRWEWVEETVQTAINKSLLYPFPYDCCFETSTDAVQ